MWSRIMLMCIFVGSILPASEMFVDDDGDDIFGEDVETEDNRSSTSGGRFRQVLKSCDFVDLNAVQTLCGNGRKIKVYKVNREKRKAFSHIKYDRLNTYAKNISFSAGAGKTSAKAHNILRRLVWPHYPGSPC